MNFGKFDAIMLLTMSLAIISMSFVFPAIGLTNADSVGENEIPEFSVDVDRFDIAGGFPTAPRSATTGVLDFDSSQSSRLSENRIWLEGDTTGGYEMFLSENTSGNTTTAEVTINNWDSGNVTNTDSIDLASEGDSQGLVVDEYGVQLTAETVNTPLYEVSYEITSRPSDNDGFIGSVFGVGEATAQTLFWFGQIFFWFLATSLDIIVNAVNALAGVTIYLLSLVTFLVTSYTGIISAAQGFATVFVAIPGIILGVILAKMVIIGVGLLPTT